MQTCAFKTAFVGLGLLLAGQAPGAPQSAKLIPGAAEASVAAKQAARDSLTVAYTRSLWPTVGGVATVYYSIDPASDPNATSKINAQSGYSMPILPMSFSGCRGIRPTAPTMSTSISVRRTSAGNMGDKASILRPYGAAPTSVTVTSNPVGLSVIVNGVTVMIPQVFAWPLHSSHLLNVSSDVQSLSGGAWRVADIRRKVSFRRDRLCGVRLSKVSRRGQGRPGRKTGFLTQGR